LTAHFLTTSSTLAVTSRQKLQRKETTMQVTRSLVLLLAIAVAVVSCARSPFAKLARPAAALLSSATVLLSGDAARAAPPVLELYTNAQWHTSLKHPADWEMATATLSGDRTLVAFTGA
jgi:hypothetical protein